MNTLRESSPHSLLLHQKLARQRGRGSENWQAQSPCRTEPEDRYRASQSVVKTSLSRRSYSSERRQVSSSQEHADRAKCDFEGLSLKHGFMG